MAGSPQKSGSSGDAQKGPVAIPAGKAGSMSIKGGASIQSPGPKPTNGAQSQKSGSKGG